MDYYNQIAGSYEELHKEEQLNKLRIIKENLHLSGTEKILDVGCGPCWSTEFFNHVAGIDTAFGLLDNGKLVVNGEAERLPFKNASFDVVLCVTAVHHFDVERAFREMKRVAKPDAVYIITVLNARSSIIPQIKEHFNVDRMIEEDKDTILFLSLPAPTETYSLRS